MLPYYMFRYLKRAIQAYLKRAIHTYFLSETCNTYILPYCVFTYLKPATHAYLKHAYLKRNIGKKNPIPNIMFEICYTYILPYYILRYLKRTIHTYFHIAYSVIWNVQYIHIAHIWNLQYMRIWIMHIWNIILAKNEYPFMFPRTPNKPSIAYSKRNIGKNNDPSKTCSMKQRWTYLEILFPVFVLSARQSTPHEFSVLRVFFFS